LAAAARIQFEAKPGAKWSRIDKGGGIMKMHRIIIGAMLALIPLAVLTAAPSIQQISVPPPGQYSIERLWNVTLNNPDSKTYEVWLEGTVTEAAKGQAFWAKTKKFQLPSGSKVIRYADIQSIGIDQQTNAPGYKDFAARTGGLPEGDYTFTVKLEPSFGGKSVKFPVKPTGPPRLISPRSGDSVTSSPQFVWTPPSPAPKGRVTYELKLVQMMPGQTPEEAMRANKPWFEKKGIRTTNLVYPADAKPLDTARTYAWLVSVPLDGQRELKSLVGCFDLAKVWDGEVLFSGCHPPTGQVVWQHRDPSSGADWDIYSMIDNGLRKADYPDAWGDHQALTLPGDDMDPAIAGHVFWSHKNPATERFEIWYATPENTQPYGLSQPGLLASDASLDYMDPAATAFRTYNYGYGVLCVWIAGQNRVRSAIRTASQSGSVSVSSTVELEFSDAYQAAPDACAMPEVVYSDGAEAAVAVVAVRDPNSLFGGYRVYYSTCPTGSTLPQWTPLEPIPSQVAPVLAAGYKYDQSQPAEYRLSLTTDDYGAVIVAWADVNHNLWYSYGWPSGSTSGALESACGLSLGDTFVAVQPARARAS
jgi:hypothetical protein